MKKRYCCRCGTELEKRFMPAGYSHINGKQMYKLRWSCFWRRRGQFWHYKGYESTMGAVMRHDLDGWKTYGFDFSEE